MAASDIEHFIENAGLTSVDAAIIQIIKANESAGMRKSNTVICMKGSGYWDDDFEKSGIQLERAAEDDATTLAKTVSWYKKFVKTSRGPAQDKAELKERISMLKQCVKSMEMAKRNLHGEKVTFMMKDLFRLMAFIG